MKEIENENRRRGNKDEREIENISKTCWVKNKNKSKIL